MFSKITFGALALSSASAMKLSAEREPLLSWSPKPPKSHPINYFVPDFGMDHDIIASQNHIKLEERLLNNPWTPVLKKDLPDPHPTNYFVPNFGLDTDIKSSLTNLKTMEKKYGKWDLPKEEDVQLEAEINREPLLSTLEEPKKKKGYPVNYFVPNFGVDEDVLATQASSALEEKLLDNKWDPVLKKHLPKPPPKDYFVPDFGLDEDINTSLKNLKVMEKKYGKWDLPKDEDDVQLDAKVNIDREPLLSWSPKVKKTHPMNYFVPDFGTDHDIAQSLVHEKAAESTLSHNWVLKKDKDDKWILPDKEIEFTQGTHPTGSLSQRYFKN